MLNKYYKYLPWLFLVAIGSYKSATHYGKTSFDVFYMTTIFLIVCIALLFLQRLNNTTYRKPMKSTFLRLFLLSLAK